MENQNYSKTIPWIFFSLGILYCAGVFFLLKNYSFPDSTHFWLISLALFAAGTALAVLPYGSGALLLEFTIVPVFWLIYKGKGYENTAFIYLPFISAVLISLGYRIGSKLSALLACAACILWFAAFNKMPSNFIQYALLSAALLMLLIYAAGSFSSEGKKPAHIDLIVCSYSGNTAHYAHNFVNGAKDGGALVSIHRFHYFRDFDPVLIGDSLAVAFPVFGCKPPWPLLSYLLFKLPPGKGRRAFIMASCAGGPENSGTLVWFILTIKGYRVTGRNWAIYPMNVTTFRLISSRLWKAVDSLTPLRKDALALFSSAREFAGGKLSGLPTILWPTPIFMIGMLIDNKLSGSLFYYNHAIRKRCNQCGTCIDYCPAERLKIVDGYPKSKGACALCLGCVNNCPRNAMQIWLFTEYGIQYRPPWDEYIVKNKKEITL